MRIRRRPRRRRSGKRRAGAARVACRPDPRKTGPHAALRCMRAFAFESRYGSRTPGVALRESRYGRQAPVGALHGLRLRR
ncbi:hypothetical protein BLAT2472_40206 [Burkholderia latens]